MTEIINIEDYFDRPIRSGGFSRKTGKERISTEEAKLLGFTLSTNGDLAPFKKGKGKGNLEVKSEDGSLAWDAYMEFGQDAFTSKAFRVRSYIVLRQGNVYRFPDLKSSEVKR